MDPRIHQLQHQPLQLPKTKKSRAAQPKQSFQEVLNQQAEGLKLSKHAKIRLQERNIHIQDKQWQDITSKVTEAKTKGVTDSLVLTKEAALVVSTKNQTVITAMGRQEASSQIFTNIDGTIVMEE